MLLCCTCCLVQQGMRSYDDPMPTQATSERETAAGRAEPARAGPLDLLRRELARGTAELAVLSILCSGRRYGYELLRLLHGTGRGLLEIREGTLYPLLHRLEDAGHVIPAWQAEGRARPRKYYAITAQGRSHVALLRAEWSGLVDAMQELLTAFEEGQP
jgi:PadR family transcriptional regulator, regulatory protein PadR